MRLKEILQEQGITMRQFAEHCGCSYNALYQQVKSPSYPTLTKWASVLNIPMYELFVNPQELTTKESNTKEELCGYIRYKGIAHTFENYEQFCQLYDDIKQLHEYSDKH